MSACSRCSESPGASRSALARRGLIAALAGLLLAAPLAQARVRVNGIVLDDSGRARHLHLTGGGLRIERGTARADSGVDSLGTGALVIDEGSGMVRFLSDAHVKEGEHVDGDVVAIFGSVRVDGSVTGSAVAIFGNVDVGPRGSVGDAAVAVCGSQHNAGQVTGAEVAVLGSLELGGAATCGDDAVAVGGRVSSAPGAHIAGESVSLSLFPLTLGLPALPTVIALILIGWLVTVFFGWVFAALFPERLTNVAVTSSRRTFLSIVIAALSLFLWPMGSFLLMATIIGLPVGILMLLAYPVLVYAGQIAATYVLGCKLMRRRLGEGPAIGPIAAGSALIAVVFVIAAVSFAFSGVGGALALFFGLAGLLVLMGLTTIGTGAFLLSRGGSGPREGRAPSPVAASAPAAAGPGSIPV